MRSELHETILRLLTLTLCVSGFAVSAKVPHAIGVFTMIWFLFMVFLFVIKPRRVIIVPGMRMVPVGKNPISFEAVTVLEVTTYSVRYETASGEKFTRSLRGFTKNYKTLT